ncbi:CPBP family intramembrane glutamic endopeptidase [Lentiprolixibacter aurantiacus]|uniref:Type II CAAX endopeptidase family protein n=1 Tax=Lentiprolixibacter aurantiacus TaxID=2993939 RepID=A0AAE3SM21_9FLAO|nr:type II CAAX endopeptidase family protein [Lentiprolixibacter aurantiacus]MCX2718109.1 type II CAAX endopeptidase family protein [Lentiprolixibacter aurantiacus]
MRTKIFNFLTSPIAVIVVILITAGLQSVSGNLAYFFGIIVALIALWGSKFKWSEFGINKFPWLKTCMRALLLAVLIYLGIDFIVQPLIEHYLGAIDLSALDHIRGSLVNYLIFIVIMWVFAAFGEEFLYRGYFMKRVALFLGDTDKAWLTSAVVISALFGLAHYYQGLSGMITTGLIGFLLALIFYKNRNNLGLAILTHGFYDMIGITLIYLNKERLIADWIGQFL